MGLLISDIIKMADKQLQEAGIINHKGEAEQIYCHIKKLDKMGFFQRWSKEAEEGEINEYFSLVKRRTDKEPLQLILGEVEFFGYRFLVRPNVLIPRMDTEPVVAEAVKLLKNKNKILDMCCGSGIMGITLMSEAQKKGLKAKLTSVDISDEALSLAKDNAKINNVEIEILKSDLFESKKLKKYDIILSNPPYIPSDDIESLDIEVKNFDPILALDGGSDGLDFYRKIIVESKKYLKKQGWIVFEIGYNQGISVAQMLKENGFVDIEITRDLSGRDRAVKAMISL